MLAYRMLMVLAMRLLVTEITLRGAYGPGVFLLHESWSRHMTLAVKSESNFLIQDCDGNKKKWLRSPITRTAEKIHKLNYSVNLLWC